MFEGFVALPMKTACPDSSFITTETTWINKTRNAVLSVCHFDTVHYDVSLFSELNIEVPDELVMAVKKRQSEFLAGRLMALLAWQRLGKENKITDIAIGRDRCPKWPEGISGSISHTNHTAMAVVRKSGATFPCFTGIDIEPVMDFDIAMTVGKDICQQAELRSIQPLGYPENVLISLIFSAKEALFKATYPKVGKYFDFDCATVGGACVHTQTLVLRFTQRFAEETGIFRQFACFFRVQQNHVTTLIID